MRYHCCRCFGRNALKVTLLSIFGLLLYIWIRPTSDEQWYHREAPCFYSEDLSDDMEVLAARVHDILDQLKVRHFLCYGSLWGALRMERMLPWDPDLDVCVISEDLNGLDEAYFYRIFRGQDLAVMYNPRQGMYHVSFGKAKGELVLFEQAFDADWFRRIGWEGRLFPKDNMKFPARLARAPHATLRFMGLSMPGPREDMEIQKYFYPHDWWKEVKPPGC